MMRNLVRHLSTGLLVLCAWSGAQAQTAFSLAAQPLNVANNISPNVVFALSVEFPTAITPAYSAAYSASSEYLGYFDPNKCYDYNSSYNAPAPSGTSDNPSTTAYFVPNGAATSHACNDHWSGNFLNWVSMAGLDEFRYAMTGGTRVVDTTSLTVLQRSFQTNQGSNFTEKSIANATGIMPNSFNSSSNTYYFNSNVGGSVGMGVTMRFGTSPGSSSNAVYVQVKVCVTGSLESNCTAYTNSSGTVTYKPTGAIQNNSDSMRFSVFSYFNSDNIDNAVMRAKMKFTGQYTYDASGVQSANSAKEWDPATGIYVTNPDNGDTNVTLAVSATRSGVANYVNLFGTGGVAGTNTRYKKYDNVGKLYYEAMAYLRKRTLDSAFNSGATLTNSDNFPVISAYTEDPVQAYCQKNFIFVMGDTHTHCDKRLPGGAYTSFGPSQCNNPVNDQGALSNGDTLNLDTLTGNISSSLKAQTTFSGGAGYYMSGLAFWAHINDIRTDLNTGSTNKTTVTTYIVDVQEGQDEGVNSQYWYAAKYGGFDTGTGATTPTSSAVPSTSNWATFDAAYDGSCTSVNGGGCSGAASNDGSNSAGHGVRPKTYLPAGNPLAMITAVNSAFSAISAATKGDAAVTSSSGNLSVTGSVYQFQSTFTSVSWTGDLSAYSVSVATSGVAVSLSPAWTASTKLNAGTPSSTGRVILSYNDGVPSPYSTNASSSVTGGLARQGVAFGATGDLSAAQQTALDLNIGGVSDGLGTNRINYIRGSRADEPTGTSCTGGGGGTGNFRCRYNASKGTAWLLGDIVHSQPAVVGNPLDMDFSVSEPSPTDALFQPGYISFAINKQNRAPAVYVGANDGMLHGFNADSSDTTNLGKEILAYVPSPVVKNLSRLTSSSYAHTYYVDASPRVSSYCSTTPATGCDAVSTAVWKTALVSGLGAGGQGIFALDVTTPTYTQPSPGSFSSTVMWEFNDHNDADLGFFLGKPVIARMNNGKWAAIFGNGYNNSMSDGAASTTGRGYLYIVFLDGPQGANHQWTVNSDYIKLLAGTGTPSTTPGTAAIPNGLGTPVAIDTDLDGKVDYIYAGDVYGNVWKFDVSSATATSWVTGFSGAPLFSARDASGNVQPVTAGLGVSFSLAGGILLNFGTGKYLSVGDANTTTQQTYYGVLDVNDGTTKPPVTAVGSAPGFRATGTTNSLQKQQVIFGGYFTGSAANQTVSGFTQNATANCVGIPINSTCITVQSDCKVNYPGLNLATTLNTTTTSCPAAITTPPVQLGWYFDLPNPAEREVEDRPIVQAGTISFTSLVPSGAACSGGLAGYPYILDANTGSRPSATVFDITGSGIANAAQQFTVGGVPYVISGISLPAGATVNTPATYQLPQRGSDGSAGNNNGTTNSVGATGNPNASGQVGCESGSASFIPGWGCVGVPQSGGAAGALAWGGQFGIGLFLPGQANRLYWRQLFTQ